MELKTQVFSLIRGGNKLFLDTFIFLNGNTEAYVDKNVSFLLKIDYFKLNLIIVIKC